MVDGLLCAGGMGGTIIVLARYAPLEVIMCRYWFLIYSWGLVQVLDGVMFNKDVTHSKMRRKIENPRILLLDCPLEYKKGEVSSSALKIARNTVCCCRSWVLTMVTRPSNRA